MNNFKRRVRERQATTGETYCAARMHVIAERDRLKASVVVEHVVDDAGNDEINDQPVVDVK